jgi:hypothetical protein
MFTYDIDGDGKADIVSSSAHNYGLWWHQQRYGKDGPSFLRHDFFKAPPEVAKLPKDHKLSAEEVALYNAVNKVRNAQGKASWKMNVKLSALARAPRGSVKEADVTRQVKGAVKHMRGFVTNTGKFDADEVARELLREGGSDLKSPALEIGVGFVGTSNDFVCFLIIVDTGAFALPAQTHALHCVDINGDGLKDLVTGRRWWAHGPRGDAGPNDPAYLYWFEAKRDKDGLTTFLPHEIDDDSGIGTQFAVHDMNGDGLLDIIISNKKGVFLFLQVRDERKK